MRRSDHVSEHGIAERQQAAVQRGGSDGQLLSTVCGSGDFGELVDSEQIVERDRQHGHVGFVRGIHAAGKC